MKYPEKLNPLRRTQFAWLVPLTWAIVQCAALAAPTTVEVFLHHRFGARSGKTLIKGLLVIWVVALITAQGGFPATIPLFPAYVFAYGILALVHWYASQRRPAGQIHSRSTGEPWPIWRELPLATTTVQQYAEPALCLLIGFLVLLLDSVLGHWLMFAAIALFIKEQLGRARRRSRQLDALDNRIETERLTPQPRPETERFVEARPAPPINRHRP